MGIMPATRNLEVLISAIVINRLTPEQYVHLVKASRTTDAGGNEEVEVLGQPKCIIFTREEYDQWAASENMPSFTAPVDHRSNSVDSYLTSVLYPFVEWMINTGRASLD